MKVLKQLVEGAHQSIEPSSVPEKVASSKTEPEEVVVKPQPEFRRSEPRYDEVLSLLSRTEASFATVKKELGALREISKKASFGGLRSETRKSYEDERRQIVQRIDQTLTTDVAQVRSAIERSDFVQNLSSGIVRYGYRALNSLLKEGLTTDNYGLREISLGSTAEAQAATQRLDRAFFDMSAQQSEASSVTSRVKSFPADGLGDLRVGPASLPYYEMNEASSLATSISRRFAEYYQSGHDFGLRDSYAQRLAPLLAG